MLAFKQEQRAQLNAMETYIRHHGLVGVSVEISY